MTPNILAANQQARLDAEAVMELIGDEHTPRFWECLASMIAGKLPPKSETPERYPPLDDREANRFETERLPYGKYAGTEVGQAPIDYLIFLTEGDEFTRKLRRYVKSKMFQQRQEEEGE